MSRYYSYLNSAIEIITAYRGEEPLSSFLKKSFSQHKKYGSTDRKWISHLCYCYFRLGKALQDISMEERIITGLYLCSKEPNDLLQMLRPAWNELTSSPLSEKWLVAEKDFSVNHVFPWKNELSPSIEYEKFAASFFIQPDLFLRLRPGKEETVKTKLKKEGIEFAELSDTCIALSNTSKIDSVIEIDKEAVVQDYSSQQTAEFLNYSISNQKSKISVWDCCAGSGGKSIMTYDLGPSIDLTVSDIRVSILVNLKKRLQTAGIRNYKSFVADLSHSPFTIDYSPFDVIIADIPCTGSGTWSRSPEQLYYFDSNKLEEYATLQRKIISNATSHLAPGGYFLYITCSVFKKENEEQVDFINKNFHLELIRMEVLKGYDKKADTMFAALLRKSL